MISRKNVRFFSEYIERITNMYNFNKFYAYWLYFQTVQYLFINFGSVAKNPKIEAKIWFHIKEYKKAEYFSNNI